MTEAELQQAVIDLAHLLGWRVAHFRPARTSDGWRTPVAADGKGFPDLVLVRDRTILFVELKSQRGRLTDEQKHWGRVLLNTDARYEVWRPDDWTEGHIENVLKGDT